jgi:hypothetical protein
LTSSDRSGLSCLAYRTVVDPLVTLPRRWCRLDPLFARTSAFPNLGGALFGSRQRFDNTTGGDAVIAIGPFAGT